MKNNTHIMDYFEHWAEYLQAIRQVRKDTISFYKDKIKSFIAYSGETDIAILGRLFDFELAYFRFAKAPLADSTKSKTWTTLSEYADWLVKKRIIPENAPRLLGTPPVVRRPEIIPHTRDEIFSIENAIKKRYSGDLQERNLLIFEIFLYTGIRHNEFRHLRARDIHESYIHIIEGKGGKDRIVAIPHWLGKKILDFIKKHNKKSDDFLFTKRESSECASHRLASAIFKQVSDILGIHVHPHKLRHTYATQSLIAGMDPHILQKQLGHETLEMTMSYVHILTDIRIEKIQNFVKPHFGSDF